MGQISNRNDGTIDRVLDIMQGHGQDMLRMGVDYRKTYPRRKILKWMW
jgi:hypothetical protein